MFRETNPPHLLPKFGIDHVALLEILYEFNKRVGDVMKIVEKVRNKELVYPELGS